MPLFWKTDELRTVKTVRQAARARKGWRAIHFCSRRLSRSHPFFDRLRRRLVRFVSDDRRTKQELPLVLHWSG